MFRPGGPKDKTLSFHRFTRHTTGLKIAVLRVPRIRATGRDIIFGGREEEFGDKIARRSSVSRLKTNRPGIILSEF